MMIMVYGLLLCAHLRPQQEARGWLGETAEIRSLTHLRRVCCLPVQGVLLPTHHL